VNLAPQASCTSEIVPALPLSDLTGRLFAFDSSAAHKAAELNHGIHKYPAKFIPQIPRWAIEYLDLGAGDCLLDPFAGSGTTLVEGIIAGCVVHGYDVNPLARLISVAKCTIWTESPDRTLRALRHLETSVRKDRKRFALRNQRDVLLHPTWKFWFPEKSMRALIRIKRHILLAGSGLGADQRRAWHELLLVVLSETAKKVSYLDERQIKVRFHKDKFPNGLPAAEDVFFPAAKRAILRQGANWRP
jgi:hypothetical protein